MMTKINDWNKNKDSHGFTFLVTGWLVVTKVIKKKNHIDSQKYIPWWTESHCGAAMQENGGFPE